MENKVKIQPFQSIGKTYSIHKTNLKSSFSKLDNAS